jgi:3-hydroxyisobutyrate dehydrogenase
MNVAFIGTGIMGGPMAGHLLAAGHPLTVHNRTKSKADALLARGAKWAATPADAARDAEAVFVCVTDTPDVQRVALGQDGILESARPGTIVVDHSTISPSATRTIAAKLKERNIAFLDAPVSGGDVGARNATLAIMVGGEPAALERVRPLLEKMGKSIVHCGPAGAGQLTKLVNQVLVSVTNLAVCEALVFARKSGLDLAKTIAAVGAGAAGSWQLNNLGPRMAAGDFAPGFTIDLMQKDMRLVLAAAAEAGVALPAGGLVHQLFTSAQGNGDGKAGTQALFKVIERLAGDQSEERR